MQVPEKELVIKVIAMPADTNPGGDMFGGWIVSQMDLAAWSYARKLTAQRIVTIAIDKLKFLKPVAVGDGVLCYASLERQGTTSATIKVEVLVERAKSMQLEAVTEGSFTFVAIGADRKPVPFAAGLSS
jgi:acyl-CoA thioesterase YciA